MESDNKITFYLPWRLAIIIPFVALAIPTIYLSISYRPYEYTIFYIFSYSMAIYAIWSFSIISVSDEGLIISRIYHLKWDGIKSVHITKFVGLPYILIKRHKGFSWWFPLYYKGKINIKDALLSTVPSGNPIRGIIDKLE